MIETLADAGSLTDAVRQGRGGGSPFEGLQYSMDSNKHCKSYDIKVCFPNSNLNSKSVCDRSVQSVK